MKCPGMSFRQHGEHSVLGTLAGETGTREFEPKKCMSENSAPFVQLIIPNIVTWAQPSEL